jgi:hypothetical protein
MDNGSHFTGEDFILYLKEKGIRYIIALVTAPWLVRFIKRII